jgi:hypothetical protein
LPELKTHSSHLARVLAIAIGVVWAILTLPALVIAGLAMMAGDPGANPVYSILVYTGLALPALTVFAAMRSFKAGAQGDLRSVAINSAGLLVAVTIVALILLAVWR